MTADRGDAPRTDPPTPDPLTALDVIELTLRDLGLHTPERVAIARERLAALPSAPDQRRAVEKVIPTLAHWPEGHVSGAGWNRDTEPHSAFCPPCVLRAALSEATTSPEATLTAEALLGYLWTATGKNPDLRVCDLFADTDPLVADVDRVLARLRGPA